MDERERTLEQRPVDAQAPDDAQVLARRWRTLPPAPDPATWVETVDDHYVAGAAEPAGDVDLEFLLRHAG